MKIGFVGAGGTGKTTVAKLLAECTGLPFIPSPSRGVFEKHGVKTEDDQLRMSAQQRLDLQMDIFHAIDKQVFETEEGIFDRTHVDNYYMLLFRCHDIVGGNIVRHLGERAFEGLETFTHIWYAPIYYGKEWQIDDGMRTQSLAARRMMDFFIRGFLSSRRPHFILDDESPEARVKTICLNMMMGEVARNVY